MSYSVVASLAFPKAKAPSLTQCPQATCSACTLSLSPKHSPFLISGLSQGFFLEKCGLQFLIWVPPLPSSYYCKGLSQSLHNNSNSLSLKCHFFEESITNALLSHYFFFFIFFLFPGVLKAFGTLGENEEWRTEKCWRGRWTFVNFTASKEPEKQV